MSVQLREVRWGVAGREIVRGVTLDLEAGRLIGLVGPNGCGKSSLLRLITGVRGVQGGSIELDGTPVASIPRRELARRVAFVDQMAFAQDDYTARQVVELGRAPFVGRWASLGAGDHETVTRAMASLGIAAMENKRWGAMSGGERQRVHIARALAQCTPVLVLDEPLNHLDIHHQVSLMAQLRRLAREGRTVVVSLHDLTVAVRRCDDVVVMSEGEIAAMGSPIACLQPELVQRVFGVEASLETCSRGEPLLALHEATR